MQHLERIYAGGKITEAGFYRGVPIEDYHGQLCTAPSISSTGLRKIEQTSLKHFWNSSSLNPAADPFEESEALIFGRAAHLLLLGETGFRETFCIRPDTYADEKTGEEKRWTGAAGPCKRWLAQAKKDKLSVLTNTQVKNIRGMAEALHEHPEIRNGGLLNGLPERSMFYRTKAGVWLKNRPDNLPVDDSTIVDLKTTESAHPASVRKSISEFGYHQQLALAGDMIRLLSGRRITENVLVFVEKTPPYAINIKPVSTWAIQWGHRQNQRAIALFEEAVRTNEWPAYEADDNVEANLTDRLAIRLQWENDNGLLPHYAEEEPITEDEAI